MTNEELNQMIEDRKVDFNQNWRFKLNANPKEAVRIRCRCYQHGKSGSPHDWSIFNDFDISHPPKMRVDSSMVVKLGIARPLELDEKDLRKMFM